MGADLCRPGCCNPGSGCGQQHRRLLLGGSCVLRPPSPSLRLAAHLCRLVFMCHDVKLIEQ